MQAHPRPAVGVALVLAAAMLWGTTGTAQTFTSGALSPLWFGALRLAVAAAFFGLCVLCAQRMAASAAATSAATGPGREAGTVSILSAPVLGAGLCMAVYNLAFFAGVKQTGVAVGTAVALGSGPLWAGVLQALIVRALPRPSWWLGTLAAVAGGVLLAFGGDDASARLDGAGLGLCLLAGLSYAVYTLLGKRVAPHMPASRFTFGAFSLAALVALPAAVISSGLPRLPGLAGPTMADGTAVLYVGVVTAGVAYLLFSLSLRHISAAAAVTLALLEPVTACVLAVAVVGESLSTAALAGLALVLLGVLAVVRDELRGGQVAGPEPEAAGPGLAAAAGGAPRP